MIVILTAIGAAWDFCVRKIPNWLIYTGLILWGLFVRETKNIIPAIGIFIMLLIVRNIKPKEKLIGAGDLKMIFLITLFQGFDRTLYSLLICFVFALIQALFFKFIQKKENGYRMALGPALLVGVIGGMYV